MKRKVNNINWLIKIRRVYNIIIISHSRHSWRIVDIYIFDIIKIINVCKCFQLPSKPMKEVEYRVECRKFGIKSVWRCRELVDLWWNSWQRCYDIEDSDEIMRKAMKRSEEKRGDCCQVVEVIRSMYSIKIDGEPLERIRAMAAGNGWGAEWGRNAPLQRGLFRRRGWGGVN